MNFKQLIPTYINRSYNLISKKQRTKLKMFRRPEQTSLQRRYTDGQQANKKMLNITKYQKNANQNHIEIPPHTCQMGIIIKSANKCWQGFGEKGTLVHSWWKCKLVQPLWKKIMEFPQKTKNRFTK